MRWLGTKLVRWGYRLLGRDNQTRASRAGGTERVYFTWRWNSPDGDKWPVMLMTVDDLRLGVLDWTLSPAQTAQLCRLGLACVADQMIQFGDETPREYDVRKVGR